MNRIIETISYGLFFLGPILLTPLFPGINLESEKRVAIALPKIKNVPVVWEDVKRWPRYMDSYLEGSFGGRCELITLDSIIKYKLCWSSNPDVYVGVDGWLFNKLDYLYPKHVGACGLTALGEKEWLKRLLLCSKDMKAQGKAFYYSIAPNKHSIYTDKLSSGWAPLHTPYIRSLCEKMKNDERYSFYIDLFSTLRAARHEGLPLVYNKYDTHWSDYGAYESYRKIVKTISDNGTVLPLYAALPDTDALEKQSNGLAQMIGLDAVLYSNVVSLSDPLEISDVTFLEWMLLDGGVVCTNGSDEIKAVVYCDSFTYLYMRSWLAYSLGTTQFIHHRHFRYHNAFLRESAALRVLLIQVERTVPFDFATFAGVACPNP